MNEGYVKFAMHLTDGDFPVFPALERLNKVRTELHDSGLIGVLPNGIGYGNVSVRLEGSDKFVISGTATGAKRVLAPEDYSRVDSFNPVRNEVFCAGRIRASAESMSHGAVYQANPAIHCVIHVHSQCLFRFMLNGGYRRTPVQAAYGTPEIAEETVQLVRAAGTAQGLFVMAGHEDGVIAYGEDADQTKQLLFAVYQKSGAGKYD
jgi:ribulose-5-phosphate 4-epimerase/fuculose-1-phosphate aldolase